MYAVLILAFFTITVGQFACSVYLPSMPAMVHVFRSSAQVLELTYTLILIGYGSSTFIFGPLSDQLGRKRFILIGFSIYVIGSIITLLTHDISVLLIGRIVQGLGLGGVVSIGALLKDTYHGPTYLKASAYMSMGVAITPLIAPLIGGYIQEYIGWRGNFIFMLIYGIIIALIGWKKLPETVASKGKFDAKHALSTFAKILSHKKFIALMLCSIVTFGMEMSYAAAAPFLYQTGLGWSPSQYGWLALVVLIGYFTGGLLSSRLAKRFSAEKLIHVGVSVLVLGGIFFVLTSTLFTTWAILLPMMITMIGISMTLSNSGALSMMLFECSAGTASAVRMGSTMVGAGVISSLLSTLHLHNQQPLAWLIFSAAIVVNVLYYTVIRKL